MGCTRLSSAGSAACWRPSAAAAASQAARSTGTQRLPVMVAPARQLGSRRAGSSDGVSQPQQPPSQRPEESPTRLSDPATPAVPPGASSLPALQGHAQPSWPRPLRTAGGRLPRQPSAVRQGEDLLFLLTVWLKIHR